MEPSQIFAEAQASAITVSSTVQDGYPCGFAWLRIKPARGKLVSYLKEKKIGRTDEYFGGYLISATQLSGWNGQNMDSKESICNAAADVLKKHGIACSVVTRID